MMDVSTDPTLVSAQLGGHVEILEIDDLRVRVEQVTDAETSARMDLARDVFHWTARWPRMTSAGAPGCRSRSTGWSRTSRSTRWRTTTAGWTARRTSGWGRPILGASLLTARGIPAAGEYELRTSLAMLILDRLGAGGSFTELQALNFLDGVVEMGHDGPAHLAISARQPLLRGLGVYHGKRGWGVSVEFDVSPGPVTAFGLAQDRDGTFSLVAAEGTVVPGPLLQIGNTTSRVDFGRDPGERTDHWSASGIAHHWALGPATGSANCGRSRNFSASASR